MKKKRILLVEDDIPTVDIYKTALNSAKFEVDVANFGKEAIEKAMSKKPDLIILDFILPDLSGIEVLKEIKKDEKTKDIPVFMLTNYIDSQTEKEGYDLGLEKFILKTDYTPTEIAEMLKKRLKS